MIIQKIKTSVITLLVAVFSIFSVASFSPVQAENTSVLGKPINATIVEDQNIPEHLSTEIKSLEENGFNVDETIYEIEGYKFISYEKDNSIGFINFTDKNSTQLEVHMTDDFILDKAFITNENDETIQMNFDENGDISNVFKQTTSGFSTMVTEAEVCEILVELAGTGISTIYTTIAAAFTGLGGAIASVVVGLIFDFGWSYVVDACGA